MGKHWIAAVIVVAGCTSTPPAPDAAAKARTLFDHSVLPILTQSCGGNTSGCHASGTNPYTVLGPTAYDSALDYAGDFTANAPLLTSHASTPGFALQGEALAIVEEWLADERDAREP